MVLFMCEHHEIRDSELGMQKYFSYMFGDITPGLGCLSFLCTAYFVLSSGIKQLHCRLSRRSTEVFKIGKVRC